MSSCLFTESPTDKPAGLKALTQRWKRASVEASLCGDGQVRESGLRAIFVFVAPPSVEELEKRLRGRGTESEEAVQKRLEGAKAEIARCGTCRTDSAVGIRATNRCFRRRWCARRSLNLRHQA